jgi:hypothetical protein
VLRLLLFVLRFPRLRREHPEMFDGPSAKAAIDAAAAEYAQHYGR